MPQEPAQVRLSISRRRPSPCWSRLCDTGRKTVDSRWVARGLRRGATTVTQRRCYRMGPSVSRTAADDRVRAAMSFWKSTALAVALSSISLVATPSGFAQGLLGALEINSCQDYVARATSQVQMATGCNFPGPRWGTNAAAHMSWCKGVSPRARGREDDERRKALVICRGDVGVVPIANCDEYTARFRSQVELAQSLDSSCVFEGARWSTNLVQHLNWCSRNSASRHEMEDAARRKELAACNVGSK